MRTCETCGTPLPHEATMKTHFCTSCAKVRRARFHWLREQARRKANPEPYRAYNTQYQRKRRARLKAQSD